MKRVQLYGATYAWSQWRLISTALEDVDPSPEPDITVMMLEQHRLQWRQCHTLANKVRDYGTKAEKLAGFTFAVELEKALRQNYFRRSDVSLPIE